MTDKIIIRAREMFVASCLRSVPVERAALNGAYDNGTWVKQFIPAAEAEALRRLEEAEGE